jgi:hypothetical protein
LLNAFWALDSVDCSFWLTIRTVVDVEDGIALHTVEVKKGGKYSGEIGNDGRDGILLRSILTVLMPRAEQSSPNFSTLSYSSPNSFYMRIGTDFVIFRHQRDRELTRCCDYHPVSRIFMKIARQINRFYCDLCIKCI